MARFAQIFKSLGKIFLSLILGFFTGILANKATGKSEPRLIVEATSSTTAGRTVTDIKIENAGDMPLSSLRMHAKFSSSVDFSVRPQKFFPCASLRNFNFVLGCPPSVVLEPSQELALRFTSNAEHSLQDREQLISEISAAVVLAPVKASWRRSGLLEALFTEQALFGALLVLVVLLVAFLIVLLMRRGLGRHQLNDLK